jgi:hypothetical protein
VTRWARKSSFYRALFHVLHIPFVEPFIAPLFPFYFKVPIKNRLRPYPHRSSNTRRRSETARLAECA